MFPLREEWTNRQIEDASTEALLRRLDVIAPFDPLDDDNEVKAIKEELRYRHIPLDKNLRDSVGYF